MDPKNLLIRVLKGSATEEELRELELWLGSLELKKDRSSGTQNVQPPTMEDLEQIKKRVKLLSKAYRKFRLLMIAAIPIVLIALSILLVDFDDTPPVLVFKNATLDQVILTIESNYSIQIDADPVLLNCRFTGEFYKVSSPVEIISVLSRAMNLGYTQRQNNHFEFTGNTCN